MISSNQLNRIISDCEGSGYKIKIRDIAYLLLCRSFEDYKLAYKAIYGVVGTNDLDIENYNASKEITFLRTYLDINHKDKQSKIGKRGATTNDDISFEENKAEILNLIKQTQEALADGKIEAKDALKIEADLRVKLNDKFQVQADVKEQMVVVECKYNAICDCGKEIYVPTKEQLMAEYGLVEKKEFN